VANFIILIYKKDIRNEIEFIFGRLKKHKMKLLLALIVLACTSCAHTYYVVRHAEKAAQGSGMSSDVPLSEQGQERALHLRERLKKTKIAEVYSTNTIRTKATAKPTADYFNTDIKTYGPIPDSAFIRLLRSKKKNILIVGHSNTVDDIVNGLCGEKRVSGDLGDNEYNKLYMILVKGKKTVLEVNGVYRIIPPNPKF
jgi:phosphohistidine phosphatase SixA